MSCQKPNCTKKSEETYQDEHGNELELCAKHYYELVSGESERNDAIRIIDDSPPDITDPSEGGISDVIDEAPGTMPCPDCGKPMGMVSWTGQTPRCRECRRGDRLGEYTPWMGVLDPHTGEEIGPTMDRWEFGSEQL